MFAELRFAADRLAEALASADEEELVSDFKALRRTRAKEIRGRAK
jgi:hypothetical protein